LASFSTASANSGHFEFHWQGGKLRRLQLFITDIQLKNDRMSLVSATRQMTDLIFGCLVGRIVAFNRR
jgi:hypothetical protein